jgi:O-antigen ligase
MSAVEANSNLSNIRRFLRSDSGPAWWKRRDIWLWVALVSAETTPFPTLLGREGSHIAYWLGEGAGLLSLFWLRGTGPLKSYVNVWPFFLFIAYATVISLVEPGAMWSLQKVATYVSAALPAFVASRRLRPADYTRMLMLVFIIGCTLSLLVIFLIPQIGISSANAADGFDDIGGWRGIYIHKNVLGHLSGALFGVSLLSAKRLFRANWLWVLALVVSFICIAGSRSSTGLIMTAAIPAFYVAIVRPKGAIRVISIILCTVAFLTVILYRDEIVHFVLGLLGKNSSLSGRTEIWAYAFDRVSESPVFGHGFGYSSSTDFVNQLMMLFQVPHTHNKYLQTLLDTGIIGLALIVLWAGRGLWVAWRRPLEGSAEDARAVLSVLLLAWTISGFSEVSDGMLGQFFFGSVFGLYAVGSATATSRSTSSRRSKSSSSTGRSSSSSSDDEKGRAAASA